MFRVEKNQTAISKVSCLYLAIYPIHSMGYDEYILKLEIGMRKSEVEIGKLNSALRGLEG